MWGVAIGYVNAHVAHEAWMKTREGISIDPARGTDYGAAMKYWVDADGNIHVESVDLLEPPHATLEMRLVPGSNPPRYEPV